MFLIGGRGCQKGPEIAINLGFDLLLDGFDRSQHLHFIEIIVTIAGEQWLVVLGDGVELEHHQIGIVFTHGIQAVFHQRGRHSVIRIRKVDV